MYRPSAFAALALSLSAAPALAQPDGEQLFAQQCRLCHEDEAVAPTLVGVVGRKVAAGGFDFSPALKAKGEAGVTWTDAELDAFLKAPTVYAPGIKRCAAVPADDNRASIIAYMKGSTESFESVRPQLQPGAPISPPPAPPPESVQPSTGTGTEDTSAHDLVPEGANDETTSEVEPSPEEWGGDEDVTAAFGAEEGEEELAPEDDSGDEDWGDEEDVSPDDDEKGENPGW